MCARGRDTACSASSTGVVGKAVSFGELGPALHAYTAGGGPDPGVVVGKNGVVVVAVEATPATAEAATWRTAAVTDRKVAQVVRPRYRAARVLGAPGCNAGAKIAFDATRASLAERVQRDVGSEIGRFPPLFRGREGAPPRLIRPTRTFDRGTTVRPDQGRRTQAVRGGRPRTSGGAVGRLPGGRCALFCGNTVEIGAAPDRGDA